MAVSLSLEVNVDDIGRTPLRTLIDADVGPCAQRELRPTEYFLKGIADVVLGESGPSSLVISCPVGLAPRTQPLLDFGSESNPHASHVWGWHRHAPVMFNLGGDLSRFLQRSPLGNAENDL